MFKKLNGSLERYMAGRHAFPQEVSTFIYTRKLLGSKDLGFYVVRTLMCIVGKL